MTTRAALLTPPGVSAIATIQIAGPQSLNILQNIIDHGNDRPDRTGVGTLSLFGQQIRHQFHDGSIPVLTTKRVFWKGIVTELLWFMKGSTNVKELQNEGVHIYDCKKSY